MSPEECALNMHSRVCLYKTCSQCRFDHDSASAGYPVVTGVEKGEELIKAVQPTVVVPLNNSDGSYEGAVAGAITSVGSNEGAAVQGMIEELGFSDITVVAPSAPGEPVSICI